MLEAFDIDERVAVLELDLTIVLGSEPQPARWKATSRHPSSDLDMAFVLDESVPAEKLEKAIRQGAGSLLVGLELFDVYRGAGVADGHAQPGLPAAPAGARPHAHRRRHGRRRRPGPHGRGQARRRAARLTPLDRAGMRQFQLRSSGASASQPRRPGWRRRTRRHSSSGSAVNTSDGSESTTIHEPDSISASSWPGLPAGVAAEHAQRADPADDERRVGGEVGGGDLAGERREVAGVLVVGGTCRDAVLHAGEGDQRIGFDGTAGEHP